MDQIVHLWLAESGLATEAKKLGFTSLTSGQREELGLPSELDAAVHLPYFNFDKEPLEGPTAFYRVRYFPELKFSDGRTKKYDQPRNTIPLVYLAPTYKPSWRETFADPSVPLFITEGEKKAACAIKHGYPTLGLGGVWNFASKKAPGDLLETLEEIDWAGRHTYIVYDSDIVTNADVAHAARRLYLLLTKKGARAHRIKFPADNGRTEWDTFLVNQGKEAFDELVGAATHDTRNRDLADMLYDLRERPVVILESGSVYDFGKRGAHYSAKNFTDVAFRRWTAEGETGPRGGKAPKIYAANEYLEWDEAIHVSAVDVVPSSDERILEEEDGYKTLNLWRGWPFTPKRGSVTPFLDLVERFTNGDKDLRDYFLGLEAYPLQYPGRRRNVATALVSTIQGSGKSTLGLTFACLYGAHGARAVDPHTLFSSNFNGWLSGILYAFVDEVPVSESIRSRREHLKAMLTRDANAINEKYVPGVTQPNRCNYFFTTNYYNALPIEESDRRFFVLDTPTELGRWSLKASTRYYQWAGYDDDKKVFNGDGMRHLFDYLRKYKSRTFVPYDYPPVTEAKQRMYQQTRPPVDGMVWRAARALGQNENLFTAAQVYLRVCGETGNKRYTIDDVEAAMSNVNILVPRTDIHDDIIYATFRRWRTMSHKKAKSLWEKQNG